MRDIKISSLAMEAQSRGTDAGRYCTILQVLGGGFRVVDLGDRQYVASVPKELDRDANAVMHTAQVSLRTLLPIGWYAGMQVKLQDTTQAQKAG